MQSFTETPRAVILRIFGAVGILFVAMIATLHPGSMYAVVDGITGLMR